MGCWCYEHNYRDHCLVSAELSCGKGRPMAEMWTPIEGETVQVVDRDSNDYGKTGTISQKRHTPNVEKPYGVTFGDNVLRYFSRDGLTWVSSPTAQPDPVPAETPAEPSRLWVKLEYSTGGGTHATLTISGSNAEVSALAAWVAACNG